MAVVTPAPLLYVLATTTVAADYSILYGSWDPGSRLFWGDGPLKVRKDSISWGHCVRLPYRLYSDQQLPIYPGHELLAVKPKTDISWRVFVLETDQSKCQQHGRYIQIAIPSDMMKHSDILFFDSADRIAEGRANAAGAFGKLD